MVVPSDTVGPLALAAFELIEPVGRGGMGEVWRAAHRESGTPVAVKFLRTDLADSDSFRQLLRAEVRAVAGLDHPHVLFVHDQGVVPDSLGTATSGRLRGGSPYLVTEWASGGSLSSMPTFPSWQRLRATLLVVLDALAHAHARGVLHRDIKPANLLVCTTDDVRPGLKLADFGIARLGSGDGHAPRGGTAWYMAPEQLDPSGRDEGPWTDLYSLGCLAFRLATGSPPFAGDTAEDVVRAHLFDDPPRLVPRIPVPEAFEDWVLGLIEKKPARRFGCAADAANALGELGEVPVDPALAAAVVADHGGEFEELTTLVIPAGAAPPPVAPARDPEPARPMTKRRPAPLAASWRRPSRDAHSPGSARFAGVGLGLYGLRPIPVVDRDDERDLLWSELLAVGRERTARAVALTGPAGVGKSRLAEWLSERALELGAATVLHAHHDPAGGPTHGLGPMVANALGCVGLPATAVGEQVERRLRDRAIGDAEDWRAIAALAARGKPAAGPGERPEGSEPFLRFGSTRERHEALRRLLGGLASERPVVVWLDDVQWGSDALAFAERVLDPATRSGLAALLVLTARDDALVERRTEAAQLGQLCASDSVRTLEVGALPSAHRIELVEQILGLEGQLATAVAQRTGGNPLFAVHLVGDWVQRGVLEPWIGGFRLRGGERVALPDDLHQVWGARLDHLLAGRSDDAATALEIAAALGQSVRVDEWAAVCARLGVPLPWDVVGRLLDRRLLCAGARGERFEWSFAHGMLRESLNRRAAEGGRARQHHRACAEALHGRIGGAERGRIGRHFVAAGRPDLALEPLLEGASSSRAAGELLEASVQLEERENALDVMGAPDEDRRRIPGWLLRAQVEHERGRIEEALGFARRAEATARRMRMPRELATALALVLKIHQYGGNAPEPATEAQIREVQELCDRGEGGTDVRRAMMILCLRHGDLEGAHQHGLRAVAEAEAAGDEVESARILHALGDHVLRVMGEHVGYEQATRRALAIFERYGMRANIAYARLSLGEIARERRDWVGAEDEYRATLRLLQAVGAGAATVAARFSLGLALLGQRRFPEAASEVVESVRHADAMHGFVAMVDVVLAACAAGAGDVTAFDRHLEAATTGLLQTGLAEPDCAWAAEMA